MEKTTFEELLANADFINKRIMQQHYYLFDLANRVATGKITTNRYTECRLSALNRLEFFEQRKLELLYGNTATEA